MKNIKVVAFDCDGVMFDTTKANIAYYNQILDHLGQPPLTPDQFAYCHSHTVDQSIEFLCNDPEEIQTAQSYRKTMSYLPFLKYMVMEPELKQLLTALRPTYKTAVATNRSDTMDRVLKEHGLEAYFDLVVSALDVERPKPHPDPLIKILDHFQIEPDQALYVGDSNLDEVAAKAAGMFFVAYRNRSLSADFYIHSLKEIAKIIDL